MTNRFFDVEDYPREIPRRVYASYDQHADGRILFEAIDAAWFDEFMGDGGNAERWLETASGAPLSVLDTPSDIYQRANLAPPSSDDEDDDGPTEWVQIDIDAGGDDVILYAGLFAEGIRVGFSKVSAVPARVSASLSAAFDLAPHVAPEQKIRFALAGLSAAIEWVAVYDVGQGSANGLCDAAAMPLAYFDLGGGVLANTSSFPSTLTNICLTHKPPIILSHWDWDHWSSGLRFSQATSMTWLAPNQKLGAVHSALATLIVKNGQLLIWPAGLTGLTIGQVTLEKCTGVKGRNNTGLATLVDGPPGEKPILLTGDARYSVIPSGLADCHAVVVPHHGADMRNKATPTCVGHVASRAAYSYGAGNTFAHPRSTTYDNHHANMWPHRHKNPATPIDRHTPDLRPAAGHIGLSWSATAPLPKLACPGFCSLALAQR